MLALGIETSCDETSVSVVERLPDGTGKIHALMTRAQFDLHDAYGGVVPEIAARAHLSALDHMVEQTLQKADKRLADLDLIAATAGPGLIGGLIVGVMTAKALSTVSNVPWIGVNHLEGHALTARLTAATPFPYLLLLVSGGHTQILSVEGVGNYKRMATTIDDAIGEAFDKTAKLLGLSMPGGPEVERAASKGDATRFNFPFPLKGQDTLDMSFSGLKTAVRTEARKLQGLTEQDVADICASFQARVADILEDRMEKAITAFKTANPEIDVCPVVAAGGVAANREIRARLTRIAAQDDVQFTALPTELCGDNAAMIAWAGIERYEKDGASPMTMAPRPRWPLDEDAEFRLGSGRKGAKA